jgi:hypothetical protein
MQLQTLFMKKIRQKIYGKILSKATYVSLDFTRKTELEISEENKKYILIVSSFCCLRFTLYGFLSSKEKKDFSSRKIFRRRIDQKYGKKHFSFNPTITHRKMRSATSMSFDVKIEEFCLV